MVIAATGTVTIASGAAGSDGTAGGNCDFGANVYYAPGGQGGAGGAASLQCAGTLSAPSITVTKNDGSVSATIGTLLVAPGGTSVSNNGGSISIGTILFDPSSTSLTVSGTISVSTVSLVPPATADGGSTIFSASGLSAGALSVDTSNLSLVDGESITLLTMTGSVPAAWNGLTFGDYRTTISGTDLLLHKGLLTNTRPAGGNEEDASPISAVNYEKAVIGHCSEWANVRSGPGESYDIIGKVYLGETVELLEWDATETWCSVFYNGGNNLGWVHGRFIIPQK